VAFVPGLGVGDFGAGPNSGLGPVPNSVSVTVLKQVLVNDARNDDYNKPPSRGSVRIPVLQGPKWDHSVPVFVPFPKWNPI